MQNLSHPELDRDSATTQALMRRCAEGDAAASDALFAVIYEDLRRRAHLMLRRNAGNTLSTTALVHETWLKLAGSQLEPKDQSHFFAIAARAMRQVLMNAARDREALKRGGGFERITLSAVTTGEDIELSELMALESAMSALAVEDARLAQVVDLHFFAGLGFAEIARLLDLSERTVARDWRAARALLRLHMDSDA